MKPQKIYLIALFSFIFLLAGCKGSATQQASGPVVLATVNGVPITTEDLIIKLGSHEDVDQASKEKALDAIISEELMYQKAVKLGYNKDPKFQHEVRMMEQKIKAYERAEMGRRVRDTQIASRVTVTDQEIRDFYAKHADEIGNDLHLGVLEFSGTAEAKTVLDKIRSGTAFEKIAAEKFAHAPRGARRAWDKGFLQWSQMPAAFAGEVYRLKNGEVSDVLSKNPSQAYLVKVIDRKKNAAARYEDVKAIIEERLWSQKGKEAYENYVTQLNREATIKRIKSF